MYRIYRYDTMKKYPDDIVWKPIDLFTMLDMKEIVPNCSKTKHNAILNYHTQLTRKFFLDTCKK